LATIEPPAKSVLRFIEMSDRQFAGLSIGTNQRVIAGHCVIFTSMAESKAYVDGEIVPSTEAHVHVNHPGLRWGYTVYDLLITLNHEPFQLDKHVERLYRTCQSAKITMELSRDELKEIIHEVIDLNIDGYESNEDMMVIITVAGGYSVLEATENPPRVMVTTVLIPFAAWAPDFIDGKEMVIPSTRQLPNDSVSPMIKHQSRMHFVLADREAKQANPRADPLLLDHDGNVTETTVGNLFIVDDGVLRTPPAKRVLPGITRSTIIELADGTLNRTVVEEDLTPHDVYNADEVFWTNTTHIVTPITKVDESEIGTGRPGPVTEEVLDAYSEHAGVDIVERYLGHLPADEQPDTLQLGGNAGVM